MIDVTPAWAAAYVGLPYVEGGRDRSGVDCYGLLVLVNREQFARDIDPMVDLAVPSAPGSGRDAWVAAALARHAGANWVATDAPAAGDAVLMTVGGRACHVGVFLTRSAILDIHAGATAAIVDPRGRRHRNRIAGFHAWRA